MLLCSVGAVYFEMITDVGNKKAALNISQMKRDVGSLTIDFGALWPHVKTNVMLMTLNGVLRSMLNFVPA